MIQILGESLSWLDVGYQALIVTGEGVGSNRIQLGDESLNLCHNHQLTNPKRQRGPSAARSAAKPRAVSD